MPFGYIYRLKSKATGKCYVGQTTYEPYKYIVQNYKYAKGGQRKKLKKHIEKFGFNDFRIDIIDTADTRNELDNLEDDYIKLWDTIVNGLNCRLGGSLGSHSEETKQKMSLIAIESYKNGRKKSESCFKKGNKSHNKGKNHTKNAKDKMKECWKKRKLDGYKNPMQGKKHSEESLKKIRKYITVKNIETGELFYGYKQELAKKLGFNYGNMCSNKKSGKFIEVFNE